MIKIKNINGTSGRMCICGSWLKHWQRFSGQQTKYCQAIGCANRDIVGAHVQKAGSKDDSWYIYPLCNAHNRYQGELIVSDIYLLVSANKALTCKR